MTAFLTTVAVLGTLAGTAHPDRDLDLAVQARAALAADPELADVRPIVSVVDRVAVVGGAVPSAAAAARVGAVLRTVPGLTDVRVNCWVDDTDDPVKRLMADRLRPAAPPADPRPAATVTAQRPALLPPPGAFLLDPVSPRSGRARTEVVTPAAPPGPPQYPTIPAPAVPVTPADDLASAVEAVRAADRRFAGLSVAVRGDVATIRGQAADGVAWDLAAAVRKVPGVGRVVLGELTVSR